MSRIVDALAGLASPWGYLVVFGLALLESAALVGLVVPGETALLVGGFAASQGHADVRTMAVAAFAGAVIGDSVGFEVGRRMGPALRSSRLGRRVGDARWERAVAYLGRLGGKAVLTGRFVGLLRAVVPTVAGMSAMPYRTFLVWNVAGALLWAPAVVIAGYLAGDSVVRVQRWLGRASLVVGLAVVFGAVIVLAGRAAVRRRELVVGMVQRLVDRPLARTVRRRFHRQFVFLARRFDPAATFGLATTVALVAVGIGAWSLLELFEAVVGVDGVARLDRPVEQFFAAHRTSWLTTVMELVSLLGSVPGMLLAAAVVWVAARSTRRPALVTLVIAIVGAVVLSQAVRALTHRTRPPAADAVAGFDGYAFPSRLVTVAVAMCIVTAFLVGWRRSWRVQVWTTVVAVTVASAVGLSRAYLGAHWLTDVIGGVVAGAAWAVAVIAVAREAELHGSRPTEAGETWRPGRN